MTKKLSFLALGGLGRIGMNNLVVRWGERRWLIDCGVMFPDARSPFVDKVLPDLDWIKAHRESLSGIVLTHGHEDHIGAIPFVLREAPMPVYGSDFTLRLVERRFAEHGIRGADLRELRVGETVQADDAPVSFRLIRVTHSIPDAASLVIETPAGRILHTGDFKIDEDPMDGEHFDRDAFRKLGDDGVLLMLSDSTCAQVPGRNRSEREVMAGLREQIEGHPGRVLVSLFSSNVHRVRAVAQVARETGRRLCLIGVSVRRYAETAAAAGLPSIDFADTIRPEAAQAMPPNEVLIVLTGSQAERRAALWRTAMGQHHQISIRGGDMVLLSARMIPGNEADIYTMINHLARRGAQVVLPISAPIHTSGHARRDELAELIDLVRPRHFVPVHGEYSFLQAHEQLARSRGVKSTMVLTNGEEFGFEDDELVRIAEHDLTPFFHDGAITADEEQLRFDDKRRLTYNGVVSALITIVERAKALACRVDLQSRGLYVDEGSLLDEAAETVVAALRPLGASATTQAIEDATAESIRRFFRKKVGRKPVVMSFVTEPGA